MSAQATQDEVLTQTWRNKTSKQNTILTKLLLRRKSRKSFQSVLLTAGHELLSTWEKPQQFRVLSRSFWVPLDLFHPASSSKFCRWKSASLELNSCIRDLKVMILYLDLAYSHWFVFSLLHSEFCMCLTEPRKHSLIKVLHSVAP